MPIKIEIKTNGDDYAAFGEPTRLQKIEKVVSAVAYYIVLACVIVCALAFTAASIIKAIRFAQ